jgi:hypothetical protein
MEVSRVNALVKRSVDHGPLSSPNRNP